jgi:hypothetical protein
MSESSAPRKFLSSPQATLGAPCRARQSEKLEDLVGGAGRGPRPDGDRDHRIKPSQLRRGCLEGAGHTVVVARRVDRLAARHPLQHFGRAAPDAAVGHDEERAVERTERHAHVNPKAGAIGIHRDPVRAARQHGPGQPRPIEGAARDGRNAAVADRRATTWCAPTSKARRNRNFVSISVTGRSRLAVCWLPQLD